mmetsp:Transcript_14393/g.38536  ORF Transcript_14393/g.38536 Transcript_14393/m.38536 type:complete len:161 (+) Transcript_14393:274-756(+)
MTLGFVGPSGAAWSEAAVLRRERARGSRQVCVAAAKKRGGGGAGKGGNSRRARKPNAGKGAADAGTSTSDKVDAAAASTRAESSQLGRIDDDLISLMQEDYRSPLRAKSSEPSLRIRNAKQKYSETALMKVAKVSAGIGIVIAVATEIVVNVVPREWLHR